jgi:hypothetical protein
MYQLVSQVYKIAPGVLTEHGKTKVRASPIFLSLGAVRIRSIKLHFNIL